MFLSYFIQTTVTPVQKVLSHVNAFLKKAAVFIYQKKSSTISIVLSTEILSGLDEKPAGKLSSWRWERITLGWRITWAQSLEPMGSRALLQDTVRGSIRANHTL